MNNKTTRFLCLGGIIAALYTALVLIFAPISFSAVQVRVAEALTVLPYFTPAAIPGVTIGCLLGNLFCGADALDLVFGTLATLLGAVGSYAVRKNRWLVPLPPILANTVVIPWVLRFAYDTPGTIPYLMLTIGAGEVLSCYVLGMVLLKALEKANFGDLMAKFR